MEYIEFEEVKKLKKEKRYEEAIEVIYKELQINLLNVYNKYADEKIPEEKLFLANSRGFNELNNISLEVREKYVDIAILVYGGYYAYLELEDYNALELFKEAEICKRKLKKIMKKEK